MLKLRRDQKDVQIKAPLAFITNLDTEVMSQWSRCSTRRLKQVFIIFTEKVFQVQS